MKRSRFTTADNTVLWTVTVLFLILIYYIFFLNPVLAETKENQRKVENLREELNLQMELSAQKRQMENRLTEKNYTEERLLVSDDYVTQELYVLEMALADSLSYDIHKVHTVTEDGILRRQIQICYVTASMDHAIEIMNIIEQGPVRCLISEVDLQEIENTGRVETNLLVTYYEVGAGADEK